MDLHRLSIFRGGVCIVPLQLPPLSSSNFATSFCRTVCATDDELGTARRPASSAPLHCHCPNTPPRSSFRFMRLQEILSEFPRFLYSPWYIWCNFTSSSQRFELLGVESILKTNLSRSFAFTARYKTAPHSQNTSRHNPISREIHLTIDVWGCSKLRANPRVFSKSSAFVPILECQDSHSKP
jgi:hypothetical protein